MHMRHADIDLKYGRIFCSYLLVERDSDPGLFAALTKEVIDRSNAGPEDYVRVAAMHEKGIEAIVTKSPAPADQQ